MGVMTELPSELGRSGVVKLASPDRGIAGVHMDTPHGVLGVGATSVM